MTGDVPVLPLYAFRARRGTMIHFTLYLITNLKPQSSHFERHTHTHRLGVVGCFCVMCSQDKLTSVNLPIGIVHLSDGCKCRYKYLVVMNCISLLH